MAKIGKNPFSGSIPPPPRVGDVLSVLLRRLGCAVGENPRRTRNFPEPRFPTRPGDGTLRRLLEATVRREFSGLRGAHNFNQPRIRDHGDGAYTISVPTRRRSGSARTLYSADVSRADFERLLEIVRPGDDLIAFRNAVCDNLLVRGRANFYSGLLRDIVAVIRRERGASEV